MNATGKKNGGGRRERIRKDANQGGTGGEWRGRLEGTDWRELPRDNSKIQGGEGNGAWELRENET